MQDAVSAEPFHRKQRRTGAEGTEVERWRCFAEGPLRGRLHFFFSCKALLADCDFEKKITVMFYLETLGGWAFMTQIFGKMRPKCAVLAGLNFAENEELTNVNCY
jgi:hypothetical protein